MLQCVMYIFLGGVALASNGCVMDDGVIYPDKIEYVSQYSPASVPPGYTYYNLPKRTYVKRFPYNHWYYENGTWYYYNRAYYKNHRYYHHRRALRPYAYQKRWVPKRRIVVPKVVKNKKGKKKWKKH